MEERLKTGETCFRAAKNLLAIKWMDKKEVHMISTMHTTNFEAVSKYGGKQSVQKPLCVIDYNKYVYRNCRQGGHGTEYRKFNA